VVAPFERRWSYPRDSLVGAEVIARWSDGEPAAVEWSQGVTCTRSVAIPVTPIGDLMIRGDFTAMEAAIRQRCASADAVAPMPASAAASLEGSGGRVASRHFASSSRAYSWLAPWLLAFSILLALAELVVRARRVAAPSSAITDTTELAA
jgi:hypothetical protein